MARTAGNPGLPAGAIGSTCSSFDSCRAIAPAGRAGLWRERELLGTIRGNSPGREAGVVGGAGIVGDDSRQ